MAKKTIILCSVIEHDISDQIKRKLEADMKKLYAKHFDIKSGVTAIWVNIPQGQAYQNRELSSAATVMAAVENNLPSAQRVPFIEELCQLWHDATGKHKDHLVIGAPDQDRMEKILELNRQRIAGGWRVPVMAKMITRLLASKARRGYLSMNINLTR